MSIPNNVYISAIFDLCSFDINSNLDFNSAISSFSFFINLSYPGNGVGDPSYSSTCYLVI